MEIPHDRWFPAIRQRHSRRQYQAGRNVPPEMWQRLQTAARTFKPFPGVRLELGTAVPETIFKGALGSYGKIKDAPAYMAIIASTHQPSFQEAAGYTAEGLILEAASMGLSTCWVAGFFNPSAVMKQIPLQNGERILAVSPIGFSPGNKTLEEKILSGFARGHKRRPLTRFVSGTDVSRLPEWMAGAIEAVRLAPSAVNRQPWRLRIEPDSVIFTVSSGLSDFNVSKRLDCGIAMLHFDVAARFYGIFGSWEFLDAPQVARFLFPESLHR